MQQALYQKIEELQFDNQAEAQAWAKQKKSEYKSAEMVVKTDVIPVDATRRRWKCIVELKV